MGSLPSVPDIEVIPKDFTAFGKELFAKNTTTAIKAIDPDFANNQLKAVPQWAQAAVGGFTPQMMLPVSSAAAGFRTAIEANAGKALADLKASIPGVDWSKLGNMFIGLTSGTVGIGSAAKGLSNVAMDVFDAIPVLGTAVRLAVSAFWANIQAWDHAAAVSAEAFANEFSLMWRTSCNALARRRPYETGVARNEQGKTLGSVMSPADMFRGLAYAFQNTKNSELPASPSSIYLLLCGAESQGFGFLSRPAYAKFLKTHNSPGIPQHTQRVMWKLIQGIMSAVEVPYAGMAATGDQGRSLMPILQEIVRAERVAGHWDEGYIMALNNEIGRRTTFWAEKKIDCGGVWFAIKSFKVYAEADCGGHIRIPSEVSCSGPTKKYSDQQVGPFFNISQAFIEGINQWHVQLRGNFWDEKKNRWNVAPPARKRFNLRRLPKKAVLMLSKSQGDELASDVDDAERASFGEAPAYAKAVGVAGAVGAGALAFVGARRAARAYKNRR
jgi:hypothetical protein